MDSINRAANHIHGTAPLKRALRWARLTNQIVEIIGPPGSGKTEMIGTYHDWADDVLPPDVTDADILAACQMEGISPEDFWASRKVHTIHQGDYDDSDFMYPWPKEDETTKMAALYNLVHPHLAAVRLADVFQVDECTIPNGAEKPMLQICQGDRMRFMGWTGPKGVLRVRTGNAAEDGNFGYNFSPVLGNRVAQYEWTPSHIDWIKDYALIKRVHPMIIATVKMEGDAVFNDWDAARNRNSTARSLTNCSAQLLAAEAYTGGTLRDAERMEIIASFLHDEAALKVQALFALADKLVPFEAIVNQPDSAPIPDHPAALFMTVASVSRRTDPNTWNKVMGWVIRLPLELQGAVVEPVVKHYPELISTDEFQSYTIRTAPLVVS